MWQWPVRYLYPLELEAERLPGECAERSPCLRHGKHGLLPSLASPLPLLTLRACSLFPFSRALFSGNKDAPPMQLFYAENDNAMVAAQDGHFYPSKVRWSMCGRCARAPLTRCGCLLGARPARRFSSASANRATAARARRRLGAGTRLAATLCTFSAGTPSTSTARCPSGARKKRT